VNAIDQALLTRGIILRPTAPFGIPQALRATIGTPEQNVRVIEALESVLTELGHQA
jgi:histidinol-phosphate aminotransferase